MEELRDWLPMWAHDSLDLMLVVLQIAGIVFVAWFARRILRKLLNRTALEQAEIELQEWLRDPRFAPLRN